MTGWGSIPWGSGPWGGFSPAAGVDINGSFERPEPSGVVGAADLWTMVTGSAATRVAVFESGLAWDGFEVGWDNDAYLFLFDAVYFGAVLFNGDWEHGVAYEDFDGGWADGWSATWPGTSVEWVGGETFETGWDNVPYYRTYADTTWDAAVFASGFDYEGFGSGWHNDTWIAIYNWAVSGDAAYFDDMPPVVVPPLPALHSVAEAYLDTYWPDEMMA